ncbi:hypothetical protein KIN20_001206 [Parelaphostrongylus tenuis]|uniref:Uncharacterized protein n=1 Tax=Parelaphostrongylus tenuis TaxID=148309 RepID=A0AAD5LTC0_PARTN|nr:hypothetical protein KIN20_001206 [Parelaphostrongylus tenuis]
MAGYRRWKDSVNGVSGTVVFSIKIPEGGTMVREEVEEMLRYAQSPYSILSSTYIKNPDILTWFPQRHGVNLSP